MPPPAISVVQEQLTRTYLERGLLEDSGTTSDGSLLQAGPDGELSPANTEGVGDHGTEGDLRLLRVDLPALVDELFLFVPADLSPAIPRACDTRVGLREGDSAGNLVDSLGT